MSAFTIEQANVSNAPECAVVLRSTRKHSLPYLPDLHRSDEDVGFLRDRVFPTNTVFVALDSARKIVGFIAFSKDWVNHLYVLPGSQRSGIGKRLLQQAMQQSPTLKLWTFERNTDARRFYQSQGFAVVERTDGAQNEEKEPDLLLQWKG